MWLGNVIKMVQSSRGVTNDELKKYLVVYAGEILLEKEKCIIDLKNGLKNDFELHREILLSDRNDTSFNAKVKSVKYRKLYPRFDLKYNNMAIIINEIINFEVQSYFEEINRVLRYVYELMVQSVTIDKKMSKKLKDELYKVLKMISEKIKNGDYERVEVEKGNDFFDKLLISYNSLVDILKKDQKDISKKAVIERLKEVNYNIFCLYIVSFFAKLMKCDEEVKEQRSLLNSGDFGIEKKESDLSVIKAIDDNFYSVLEIVKTIDGGMDIDCAWLLECFKKMIEKEFLVQYKVEFEMNGDMTSKQLKERIDKEADDFIERIFSGKYYK